MTKMHVQCNQLWHNERVYMKGQVFEATDDERDQLLRDGNAVVATNQAAAVDAGVARVVDPVEQAIKDKQFEELRQQGVMVAPANAGSLATPQVGPTATTTERIPGSAIVEGLGSSQE